MAFIEEHKKKIDFPEITNNRVWDLLLENGFDSLESIPKVMNILRTRIDNFRALEVGNSITELVKAEYKKVNEIISNK